MLGRKRLESEESTARPEEETGSARYKIGNATWQKWVNLGCKS